jgi:hypothetical protein
MSVETSFSGYDTISFVNRDHVVLLTIAQEEIIVTTTLGMKLSIRGSGPTLAKLVDELANHVESNFVSIPATEATVSQT